MNDYVKAALYTVLFLGGVIGVVTFLGTFPVVSMYLLGITSVVLMFYTILTAIRSQRTINEIRARYE